MTPVPVLKALARRHSWFCLCLLLTTVAGTAPAAPAATTDELLSGLKNELARSAAKQFPGFGTAEISQFVQTIDSDLASGQFSDAEQRLTTLRENLAGEDKAAAIVDQLLNVVRARAAGQAANTDSALSKILSDACERVVAKASVTDYDPLFLRLDALSAGISDLNSPIRQEVESYRQAVDRAQDFAQQDKPGHEAAAADSLNEFAKLAMRLSGVPRSKLLDLQALAAQLAAVPEEEQAARFKQLTEEVARVADSAHSAADFDGVLAQLDAISPAELPRSRAANGRAALAGPMIRFCHIWQDYYNHLQAGKVEAAQTTFRDLLYSDETFFRFYPRSRLLALLNVNSTLSADPDARAPLISPDAVTLATLDQFGRQVAARESQPDPDFHLHLWAGQARRFVEARDRLGEGNPRPAIALLATHAAWDPALSAPYGEAFSRLQRELAIQGIAAYLPAPPGLTVGAQDTPSSYLRRALDIGRARGDWPMVMRALEVTEVVAQPTTKTFPTPSELGAVRLLLAGIDQERAQQWAESVLSFQLALRTGATELPAEEIGRRLQGLRSGHPEEYAVAEKRLESFNPLVTPVSAADGPEREGPANTNQRLGHSSGPGSPGGVPESRPDRAKPPPPVPVTKS